MTAFLVACRLSPGYASSGSKGMEQRSIHYGGLSPLAGVICAVGAVIALLAVIVVDSAPSICKVSDSHSGSYRTP